MYGGEDEEDEEGKEERRERDKGGKGVRPPLRGSAGDSNSRRPFQ